VFAVHTLSDSPETIAAMIGIHALATVLDTVWRKVRAPGPAAE
jgi:hypothetical protein